MDDPMERSKRIVADTGEVNSGYRGFKASLGEVKERSKMKEKRDSPKKESPIPMLILVALILLGGILLAGLIIFSE